jgi:hypothetical protein
MDPPDPVDQRRGGLGAAECGAQDVLHRRPGPPERILLVARLLLDPGHHRRVQDLEHDGGRAAERHGGQVAVDLPRHAVGAAEPGIARWPGVQGGVVMGTDLAGELVDDPLPQPLHDVVSWW